MKQQTTKAILLKRIDFGEADRILTVITPGQGKLSLLGKGTRRSKSKLAGGLELFSVTDITYIEGKSDLKTITGTKLDHYYGKIVENIEATMMAYEFLKLVDRYTEETVDSEFFELLEEGLAALNESDTPLTHTHTWFLMHLLMISGHGLNIERDLQGLPFSEDKHYQFSYDDMTFFEHKSGPFSPKHIKLLQLLSKVGKPSRLLKVQDADDLMVELEKLLKRCLG